MNQYSDPFTQFFYNLISNHEKIRSQLTALQDWSSKSDQHLVALDKIYQIATESHLNDQAQSAYSQLSGYELKIEMAARLLDEVLARLGIELPEEALSLGVATSDTWPSGQDRPAVYKKSRRPRPNVEASSAELVVEQEQEPSLPTFGVHAQISKILQKNFGTDIVPASSLAQALENAYGPDWPGVVFNQTNGPNSVVQSTLAEQLEHIVNGRRSQLESGLRSAIDRLSQVQSGQAVAKPSLDRLAKAIGEGQPLAEIDSTVKSWINSTRPVEAT